MNSEDRAFLTDTLRNFNAAIRKLEATCSALSKQVTALEKDNKNNTVTIQKLDAKCKQLEVKLSYTREKLNGVETIAKARHK